MFKLLIIMRLISFFIILFFFIISNASAASPPKVVTVQNIRIQPFIDAIRGFRSKCDARLEELHVSGMNDFDVKRKVNKIAPDLVLALGTEGLSKIKRIKNVPVIYLMVLNPASFVSQEKNIKGISIHIPCEKQLDIFRSILPDINRIGVVYNPERSGVIIKRAEIAAKKMGIRIIPKEIHNSKDVPLKILELQEEVDAFWMLPDISVITPKTIDFLLFTSFRKKIPIFSFSEKYVKMGALVSVGMDPFDIGVQAGEMATKLLKDKNMKNMNPVDARKAVISINLKIAEKFGIIIDQAVRAEAQIIE